MVEDKLKLGIIGISEGNGHPYSWASIFNGYEKNLMLDCGFPAIPEYLLKQNFPEDCIKNAEVTHIWTQDIAISKKIASTCRIKYIVEDYCDMLGYVDAILLARDDAENHLIHSLPFLKAGLPIYIDKPFAHTVKEAKTIFSYQTYPGQIFTCSALLFAKEFFLNKKDRDFIGKIKFIEGYSPKSWDKYSVHLIDPALNLIKDRGEIIAFRKFNTAKENRLVVTFKNDVEIAISTLGNSKSPIMLRVFGEKNSILLEFKDSFSAFKKALEIFVKTVRSKKPYIMPLNVMKVVELIELGK